MKIILFLALISFSCKNQPCAKYLNKQHYGYAKCIDTGKCVIVDSTGNIICEWQEKPMSHEEAIIYLNSKY